MKRRYVLGFLVNMNLPQPEVVLCQKLKGPPKNIGKWNGVGGKVEAGEQAFEAMCRECKEETGLATYPSDWRCFGRLFGYNAEIHLFICDTELVSLAKQQPGESEPIKLVLMSEMYEIECVPNLTWMLPLALDANKISADVFDPTI